MSAPVVEWQIVSPNPELVAAFYSKAFGWNVQARNNLAYRQVTTGEGGTPGGIWPAPPGVPSFVQLFIRVPSVADAITRATRHGAIVIVPESTLPDGTTMAVLHDPAGMSFGLVAS